MTSLTPPGRPAHGFTYTPVDLTSTYAPPPVPGATGYTQFGYNRDRALTSIARPDGTAVSLTYDGAGRLQTVTHPTASVSYTYAATGQVSTITTTAGVGLNFTFDGPLPVLEQWSGPVAGTLDRGFNQNFFLTTETVNGTAVGYDYDDDGLVTHAGQAFIDRSPASGLPIRVTLSGVQSEWTIDEYGEATHENHTDLQASRLLFDVTYTRDKLGRITGRAEVIDDVTRVFEYQYDMAGRLAAWLRNGSVVASYGYDANGNRTSVTTDAGTTSATFDDQDRIVTLGDATYTHTATGERLTKTVNGLTTTYAYDAFGNLVRVDLPDGRVIRYLVDGRNRRIGKLVNDVLVKGWLYGDQLRPIAELDGQGNVVARFVYGSRTNIPDYFTKDGVDYRIIPDHLGSPRIVINTQTREIVQQMDFDPWGVVTQDSNPGFQPFGFAGGLYDSDTGLVRFGERDYDAVSSRWSSKDPLGVRSTNSDVYQYANADPLNFVDPDGRNAAPVLIRTVPAAIGIASVDGPLPVGDILAVAIITVAAAIDAVRAIQNDDSEAEGQQCPVNLPVGPLGPDNVPEGWEWRGPRDKGSAYNPKTGESLHPDKAHGPFPDHYDYIDPSKNGWRVDPFSGKMTPKK